MHFGTALRQGLSLAVVGLACGACSGAKPGAPAFGATTYATDGATGPALDGFATPPEARPEHARAMLPVTTLDPQWGSVDAPVTIVEFSDFQCPFCSYVGPTLEALRHRYGPAQLRIVFKHNPLPFHENARPTAEAAAAVFMLAGSQAFFAFHDLAFANQQHLSQANLETWAAAVGVEATALRNLLASGKAGQKVDADMELATAVGALGTPAFRINGIALSGAQPLEVFVRAVDDQLAAARQLTRSGTPPRLLYPTLTSENLTAPSVPP